MATQREKSDKHYNTYINDTHHPIWSGAFSEAERRDQFHDDLETSTGVVGLITGVASLGLVMAAIALGVLIFLFTT